jgi:NAD+ synthase
MTSREARTEDRGGDMFSRDVLKLDPSASIQTIVASLRGTVVDELKRRGAVVGMSGGIDSSLVACLCVEAFGKDRVIGLFMPEFDSSPESLELASNLAEFLGIRTETVDVGPSLQVLGCYRHRDDAIRAVIPEFSEGWKSKITLPGITDRARLNVFSIVAVSPEGREVRARLPLKEYLQVVAASNMKQRIRKLVEYFHAERNHYAVAGTPNRLE